MKRMKRTLSIALAMIMALGLLTVSAYAAGDEEDKTSGDESSTTQTNTDTGSSSTSSTKSTTPLASIPVTKTVEIAKDAAIPAETFTFTITPATDTELTTTSGAAQAGGLTVKKGVALTSSTVTYTFNSNDVTSEAKEKDANGTSTELKTTDGKTYAEVKKTGQSFDLSGVTFPSTGVYRYYVTENASSTETNSASAYINYDTNTKYEVDVYVYSYPVTGDDGKTTDQYRPGNILIKKMVYTPKSVGGTQVYSWGYASENGTMVKPDACNFTNTINVNTITIKKILSGESYSTNEKFKFYIRIPAGGTTITLQKGSYITADVYNADGTFARHNNIQVVEGVKDEDVSGMDFKDSNIAQMVELEAGQYLEITAPVSMIYFVAEDSDYTAKEDYTQTYSYTETGDRSTDTMKTVTDQPAVDFDEDTNTYSSIIVKGTTNTGTNKVVFTNTRNINVETGVNVEVLPFALVLVIAGCGAALYLSNKKRTEDR
jgi:hypothetical protein